MHRRAVTPRWQTCRVSLLNRPPETFQRAESYEPVLHEWFAKVRQGEPARVLVLGPGWSGKSYTAWAAHNTLRWGEPAIRAGVADIDAVARGDCTFEDLLGTRVVVFDEADYGDPHHARDWDGLEDFVPGARASDMPDVEAMMQRRAANVSDVATRLVFSREQALLFTASSGSTLGRALGGGVARRILGWPTISLPRRPRPSDVLRF